MPRKKQSDPSMPSSRSIKEAFKNMKTAAPKPSSSKLPSSLFMSPPRAVTPDSSPESLDGAAEPLTTASLDFLVQRFEQKLQRVVAELISDLRDIAERVTKAEGRIEELQTVTLDQKDVIDALRETNLSLQLKLEDVENRSRRANLRIRGIPEAVLDVSALALELFHDLAPDLPPDRLEMDRVHRALTRVKPNGPPRDIVVALHFYRTKETLLRAARDKAKIRPLNFNGTAYQLFADLAPATIIRRREMKPSLAILQSRNIPYKWGFPFRLSFKFKERWFSTSSPAELEDMVHRLDPPQATSSKRGRAPDTPDSAYKKKPSISPSASPAPSAHSGPDGDMG